MKFVLLSLLVGVLELCQGGGAQNTSASAITPCEGENPGCLLEFNHWMRYNFFDGFYPTEDPSTEEITAMMEESENYWLQAFQEYQETALAVTPTTITSLDFEVADYNTCIFPSSGNSIINGFWCEVTVTIERSGPLFTADETNPGPPPNFRQTFESAITTVAIQNYIYETLHSTLSNDWYDVNMVGVGGNPDPSKSSENPQVSGSVEREVAETGTTDETEETTTEEGEETTMDDTADTEVAAMEGESSAWSVTWTFGMIVLSSMTWTVFF